MKCEPYPKRTRQLFVKLDFREQLERPFYPGLTIPEFKYRFHFRAIFRHVETISFIQTVLIFLLRMIEFFHVIIHRVNDTKYGKLYIGYGLVHNVAVYDIPVMICTALLV